MLALPSNALNVLNVFSYVNLALAVANAVTTVSMELSAPEPISGDDLAADVTPVLLSLQSIYPKLRVSPQTLVACCEALAKVLNERRGGGGSGQAGS